jgi:retron-type reverse transcriptase
VALVGPGRRHHNGAGAFFLCRTVQLLPKGRACARRLFPRYSSCLADLAMKRVGFLWDDLISFPNLLQAAYKAQRGKRFRPATAKFHYHLEQELWTLHTELKTRSYRPGPYRTFKIHEPKERIISAAPYRDRVVHHALCNMLEPIFEQRFIRDSYACRQGKGTHAAVRRCQEMARHHQYALKADVRKFFPSLDHELLKAQLARAIKDPHVLWLAGVLIDHSNPQEDVQDWFPGDDLFTPASRRRGLPLGNQTSQFFANVFLDALDHFITDRLGFGSYLRYVDDLVLFHDDRRRLNAAREEMSAFLAGLRLTLHANKTVVFPTRQGLPFLGYRVWRSHLGLVKANVFRFRRRLRRLQNHYATQQITGEEVQLRLAGWIGHASQADTFLLRERLFLEHPFRRAAIV